MTDAIETCTPATEIIARRLGDEMVIVNLDSNRIYELNPTATRLWELVADGLDRDGLRARLLEEFAIDAATVDVEVARILEHLVAEGLVVAGATS